jgi:hypothetical protein
MKFLDFLFSKNKRNWISFLNDVSDPMDRYVVSKWRLVVDNFFLKHNIDFDKYMANAKWDNGKLSIYQNKDDIFQCSDSFRRHFANTSERKLSNRNLGVNEWFYHAFPDVAKYFEDKYEEIEAYCNSLGYIYSIDEPKYNLHVFEFVIEQYLKINRRLECSLN